MRAEAAVRDALPLPCPPPHAEPEFRAAVEGLFSVAVVGEEELHPDYRADDISVWRLTRSPEAGLAAAAAAVGEAVPAGPDEGGG